MERPAARLRFSNMSFPTWKCCSGRLKGSCTFAQDFWALRHPKSVPNLHTEQLQCSMKHQSWCVCAAARVCAATWKPAKHSSTSTNQFPHEQSWLGNPQPKLPNLQSLKQEVNLLKRWFDGLARGVPAAAAQAERAGMERTGDGTQPGRLRAAASARCCAARTGAAGQGKRAAGFARQNGHQNATEHPSETQPTTVSHHRALQESYIHFFSCLCKFSHEICFCLCW